MRVLTCPRVAISLFVIAALMLPVTARRVRAADRQLLYTSVRDGKPNLFLISPDGTAERQLTREGASLGAWSPDRTRIAFTSDRTGNAELYVMDADGTHVRRLTSTDPDRENQVVWSPDGKKLVFHRHTDNPLSDEILVMDPDGTHELTNHPEFDGDPAWSPDGKEILFVSTRNGDGFRLFLMHPDGTEVRPLPISTSGHTFPAWSPGGKRIAYTDRTGEALEIFTSGADGSDPQKLTALGGRNTFAAWSPDGKEIAFEHYGNENDPGELWVTSADGTSQRRLGTTGPQLTGRPAWAPE